MSALGLLCKPFFELFKISLSRVFKGLVWTYAADIEYFKGIIPVIPPPANAVVHNQNDLSSWHDKIVNYIKEKGMVYAFHKKYGYGIPSKVEAQFSQIKRCIGSSLKTIKIDFQKREAIIIGNILNLWNSFGKPISVKIP